MTILNPDDNSMMVDLEPNLGAPIDPNDAIFEEMHALILSVVKATEILKEKQKELDILRATKTETPEDQSMLMNHINEEVSSTAQWAMEFVQVNSDLFLDKLQLLSEN